MADESGEGDPLILEAGVENVQMLLTIKTLRLANDRKNKEIEALKKDNARLQTLWEKRAQGKDLYLFLQKRLDNNFEVIESLERDITKVRSEKEEAAKEHDQLATKLRDEANSAQRDLRSKIQVLEDELLALQEFKRQKTQIESELRRTKLELSEAKQYHKSEIARLDRRNVQEKEKLKKEMLLKIKETKQSLLHMTEDQLHTTTKRTIMENEQMTTELQYQSKETEKVLRRVSKTMAKNKKLEREIMLFKDKDAEYARKTHFYQKLIKKLHYQIQSREKLSIESENRAMQELEQQVGEAKQESKLQLEALNSKAEQLESSLMLAMGRIKDANRRAARAEAAYKETTEFQDSAIRFLFLALDDVRSSADAARGSKMNMDEVGAAERERVLTFFLRRLQDEPVFDLRTMSSSRVVLPPIAASSGAGGAEAKSSDFQASTAEDMLSLVLSDAGNSVAKTDQATQTVGMTRSMFFAAAERPANFGPPGPRGVSAGPSYPFNIAAQGGTQSRVLPGVSTAQMSQIVQGNVRGWGSRSQTLPSKRGRRGHGRR